MNRMGSSKNLTKIRLIGTPDTVQLVAERIVNMLEEANFEVLEWSASYPCKPPDEDKNRVYLTAAKKGGSDDQAV